MYLAIYFLMRSSLSKLIHTADEGHLTVSETGVWESAMSGGMVGKPAILPLLSSTILQNLPQEQATTQDNPLCFFFFVFLPRPGNNPYLAHDWFKAHTLAWHIVFVSIPEKCGYNWLFFPFIRDEHIWHRGLDSGQDVALLWVIICHIITNWN